MFSDVPSWLTDKVRQIANDGGPPDRERVYYTAAGWTIAWYLRKDIQAVDADPFFDPPGQVAIDDDDDLWLAHANRAVLIAETLFLLRSSPGFSEQRKRLEKRPLRPTFFEMLAAKQFLKAGFTISARPESGQLGDDFDFTATHDDQTINVEVTALTAHEPSEETILNALNTKRQQLPANAPAIVYCVIPERWTQNAEINWAELLQKTARKFLRGTRRINAIVFWVEQHVRRTDGQRGAALLLVRIPYFNDAPRNAIRNIEALYDGKPHVSTALKALATGQGINEFEKETYDSAFFRWIDYLVPPKKMEA